MDDSVRGEKVQLRRSTSGPGRDKRRKTVSGYFQDWTTWMGSVENKNRQEFDRWVSQCLIKLADIVLVVGVASSD